MFVSWILFYLCGNVLIPKDEKNFHTWYTLTHFFSGLFCFLQQNYGLRLGFRFRFRLSADQVLYRSATQKLSLKTQSNIEFPEPFSGHRKVLVCYTGMLVKEVALFLD